MYRWITVCVLSAVISAAGAREASIALTFDHRLVQDALVKQVYLGPNATAQVYENARSCSLVELSDPRVGDGSAGRIRIVTKLTARGGSPLPGGNCVPLFTWVGLIEVLQTPAADADIAAIRFKVVDSNILKVDESGRAVPGVIWDWIEKYVNPRLESFTVSLAPAITETRELLRNVLDISDPVTVAIVDSVGLADAGSSLDGLEVALSFQVPASPPQAPPRDVAPSTAAELAAWDAAWQRWDAFATWQIKFLAADIGMDLREALIDVLLEARYELRGALATRGTGGDAVRGLFLSTWTRLAPLLGELQTTLPVAEAARMLSFISAANALQALDAAAPHVGFTLSEDALRQLARVLLPTVAEADLAYTTEIDPELRALLGFDGDYLARSHARGWLAWLLREAQAEGAAPLPDAELDGWVPTRDDLDRYIARMDELLSQIARSELARGKIEPAYAEVYRTLLPATAWQETCWRQYELRGGTVQPLKSPAGSVGVMQINEHVWRGVYDLRRLAADVTYNARAGNEILVHYLVDYAVRKGEHTVTGKIEDLARATYAVYNGGPGQLRRYREPDTKAALRKIDAAFWAKYRTVREQGSEAVKQCYR